MYYTYRPRGVRMRVNAIDMADAETRIRNFIKTKQRLPGYCNMRDKDTGKWYQMKPKAYMGLFKSRNIFRIKNGRFPNYVTYTFDSDTPVAIDYQNNKYNCCPTSLAMVSQKLFKPLDEAYIAKVLGTNTNGTDPAKLIANAPKLGFKVTKINRTVPEVNSALGLHKGVIIHYQTKATRKCSGFVYDYGHYAVIMAYKDGKYQIYDPTKGIYWCEAITMQNATNGRNIYFYTVELQ